jgi:hypothetical protein
MVSIALFCAEAVTAWGGFDSATMLSPTIAHAQQTIGLDDFMDAIEAPSRNGIMTWVIFS